MIPKFEKYVFYSTICIGLSMLCCAKYYITGDGPSHVYNAQTCFDILFQKKTTFYTTYYNINKNLSSNWASTTILGLLLKIAPYWLAEKLFQIAYMLLFAFGFRNAIKTISEPNIFLSVLWLPFCFSYVFQLGFYNFVLAMSAFMWYIAYCIKNKKNLHSSTIQGVVAFLLFIITFTHTMLGFVSILFFGILVVEKTWHEKKISLTSYKEYFFILLPSLFVLYSYVLHQAKDIGSSASSIADKLYYLCSGTFLMSISSSEKYIALLYSILIISVAVVAIRSFIKTKFPFLNTLIVFNAILLIAYIFSPDSVGVGSGIIPRTAMIVSISLIFFVAQATFAIYIKIATLICTLLCNLFLLYIRIPKINTASTVTTECLKPASFIEKNSTVLVLHMDDWITSTSGKVFEIDNSMLHATDYIGVQKNKNIILLNNYEASYTCFPLSWQKKIEPTYMLKSAMPGSYPPHADLQNYEQLSGVSIDYILLQNKNYTYNTNAPFTTLMHYIDSNYHTIYENYYVMLKKRN